jgi:DNA-binding SARP family transcriptional activator
MTQPIASPPAASLSIALLGPPQILRDGQPIAFAYEKVLALLAFLVIESDRAHRRTALADLLWPDQEAAAARHNLSQALFNLRRALGDGLGEPLLLTTRDSVRLNPASAAWVDVAVFRSLAAGDDSAQLEQASALYRGEFLEGFSISDSANFDEWVLLIREQLRAQACATLRRLAEPQAGLADSARVCDYARRWVALDPLDEAAHRQLMRALADNGQRAAALIQFEHCRRLLAAELGLAPEPLTVALYEELRQPAPPVPEAQARPPRAALHQPTTRLIGRERELAALAAQLAEPPAAW